jgi:hypothetical protein
MLGATTAGNLLFSVAAAVTVLAGGGLLAGVGVAHRRARHALLQHPQGPPRALRRRRLLPCSGAAAVVYLPLLAASVCLAAASGTRCIRHRVPPWRMCWSSRAAPMRAGRPARDRGR